MYMQNSDNAYDESFLKEARIMLTMQASFRKLSKAYDVSFLKEAIRRGNHVGSIYGTDASHCLHAVQWIFVVVRASY
jgi:hypothetical protein